MKKIKSILLLLTMAILVGIGSNTSYAATGTPISTPEEFLAIANNPAGNYYLANDITLPANTTLGDVTFTGTFDGNNHKIKGYTFTGTDAYFETALFPSCKNATFKNLSLTNVNININAGVHGARVAALADYAANCTFENIKTTGTITLNGAGDMVCNYNVGGIISSGVNCTLKKCTNSINIKVNCLTPYDSASVCGIGDGIYTTITDCTNKGSITLNGTNSSNAYGLVSKANKANNCKNSGKITVTYNPISESTTTLSAEVAGMCSTVEKAVSCQNTGAIKFTCNNGDPTKAYVAGLICMATAVKANVTKCSNKGKITFSGASRELYVGGVVGDCAKITQCYNTGKVSATNTSSYSNSIGGVTGEQVGTMKHCYNTGAISLKGEGNVGGITGSENCIGDTVTCCYSTGKVTGKKGANKGILIGSCAGAQWKSKRNVYNNYYTGSGKPYGTSPVTWHEWVAKATKVSSITANSCPKLSSKNWTYSTKKKRLILKNNKEK